MQKIAEDPLRQKANIRYSQRLGGIVFLVGATLEYAAGIFIGLVPVVMEFIQMREMDTEFYPEFGTFLFESEVGKFILAYLGAGLVFIVASWGMGRWAGAKIGIAQWKYGWTGILAMLLPSFAGGLSFVSMVAVLVPKIRKSMESDFFDQFTIPVMLFSSIVLLPAIAVGVLSGLVVRQRLGRMKEMALTNLQVDKE